LILSTPTNSIIEIKMTDILTTVVNSVGNYRNHKTETLKDTPVYLKSYVEQYFEKADKHFERLMDICINVPECFTIASIDITNVVLKNNEVSYSLQLTPELTDIQISESEFVIQLFKRIRLAKTKQI